MTREDARNFIIAINNIQQYVPPIAIAPLMSNPIVAQIQNTANAPDIPSTTDKPALRAVTDPAS